jgi:hypothetical protein
VLAISHVYSHTPEFLLYAMERVICRCNSCRDSLATLVNLWTRIGKTYISPIIRPTAGLNAEFYGQVREGEAATLVERW